jgi:exonuclease III
MCNKQLSKLIAITALCSDIIFLSDLRMNDDNDAVDKISKILICNKNRNYFFHYNSISNCRGVGILIACDLPCKIIYTYKDTDDNILGLVLEYDRNIFSICSVYGPNDNNRKFFSSLSGYLEILGDVPSVIGGDWNATYSQSPSNCNPDTLNMASPPSLIRSGWIADICSSFGLLDLFRAFHPTRKDFTYFPHGARKNRSRIDFFLISESLLSSCRSCNISPWLSTSLFDHKSVNIDFSKEKIKPKLFINRTIISNPRTEDVVLAAYADTYLAHADPAQVLRDEHVHHLDPGQPLQLQKGIVGNLIRLIKQFNDLCEQEILEPNNNLIPLLKAGVSTDIAIQRDRVWDIDHFSRLKLTCSDEFFFEALASNIKGSVISLQTFIKRLSNLRQSRLVKQLNALKEDYIANQENIAILENELNSIVNAKVLLKVKSMKLFSCLNSEKPTTIFLSLARSSNSSSKLENIHDDSGMSFTSNGSRMERIVRYYEDIYARQDSDLSNYDNCINDFLGDELVNHPLITNSKLSDSERANLETPLTVDELDKSINKCNLRSAPGIDGFSNMFIKKFWAYFRIPLHRYSLCCYEKGVLTSNFRSASIQKFQKRMKPLS